MGGVVDLLDDGLQVGVRQAVETGPLGQVAADPCMCSIGVFRQVGVSCLVMYIFRV